MIRRFFAIALSLTCCFCCCSCSLWNGSRRADAVWINLLTGEPVTRGEMIDDLATARVIYLGERHTIPRHHALQALILDELRARNVEFALGLEQMEARQQPALERYARGELSFDALVAETEWEQSWENCREYRPVLEAARVAGVPIIALNAPAETIRAIARGGGVRGLSADQRAELPAAMTLDDAPYERLLGLVMMSHAHLDKEKLRPMVEAQIARDETMAEHAAHFLDSAAGADRTLVVLCGAGHVNYDLGLPERLRRRVPDLAARTVILSESGELELDLEAIGGREISIDMGDLQSLARPIGDYLHVAPRE